MSIIMSCRRGAEFSEASFSKAFLLASKSISPVGVTLRKSCERTMRMFRFMAISILRQVAEVTDVAGNENRVFVDMTVNADGLAPFVIDSFYFRQTPDHEPSAVHTWLAL